MRVPQRASFGTACAANEIRLLHFTKACQWRIPNRAPNTPERTRIAVVQPVRIHIPARFHSAMEHTEEFTQSTPREARTCPQPHTIHDAAMHAKAHDPTRAVVHHDEHPVCPQYSRFAPK